MGNLNTAQYNRKALPTQFVTKDSRKLAKMNRLEFPVQPWDVDKNETCLVCFEVQVRHIIQFKYVEELMQNGPGKSTRFEMPRLNTSRRVLIIIGGKRSLY